MWTNEALLHYKKLIVDVQRSILGHDPKVEDVRDFELVKVTNEHVLGKLDYLRYKGHIVGYFQMKMPDVHENSNVWSIVFHFQQNFILDAQMEEEKLREVRLRWEAEEAEKKLMIEVERELITHTWLNQRESNHVVRALNDAGYKIVKAKTEVNG